MWVRENRSASLKKTVRCHQLGAEKGQIAKNLKAIDKLGTSWQSWVSKFLMEICRLRFNFNFKIKFSVQQISIHSR
jgi:hypothetical protein